MTFEDFKTEVQMEYCSAKVKHPDFPTDIIHAVAVICEESGEALRAALQAAYENGGMNAVYDEIIQTANTCYRAAKMMKDEGMV